MTGFTAIPNCILDQMSEMTPAEFKALLAVYRLIIGYEEYRERRRRRISLTKLEKFTSLSRQGVVNAMSSLEKMGYIAKETDGGVNTWVVNSVDYLVNSLGQEVNSVDRQVNSVDYQEVNSVDQTSQFSLPPSNKTKSSKEISKENLTKQNQYKQSSSGDIFKNAFDAFQNELGDLTPMTSQEIGDWVDDVGDQWVVDAIGIASLNNKKSWKYTEAILKRWKAEGKQSFDKPKPSPNGHHNGSGPHKETAEERYARLFPADHVNNQETIKR